MSVAFFDFVRQTSSSCNRRPVSLLRIGSCHLLKSLQDSVHAEKNGTFGQNRVATMKFLRAETVHFEPYQQFSLEVGKDSGLGAVIEGVIGARRISTETLCNIQR